MSSIPAQVSPSPSGRSWHLEATFAFSGDDEGVIYARGNENAGITIFIQNAHVVVDYNAFKEHSILESTVQLPPGKNELSVLVQRLEQGMGRIEISVNGTPSGSIELPILMGMISSMGASVGRDTGSPVSPRYEAPFEFTGDLREVTIQLATKTRQEDDENGKSDMSRQ